VVPGYFHILDVGETNATVTFHAANRKSEPEGTPVDLRTASFDLNGKQIDLVEYVNAWVLQLRSQRCNRFPSHSAKEGTHSLEIAGEKTFGDGEAVLDGVPIGSLEVIGSVEVQVKKPVVVSAFEVGTRGRFHGASELAQRNNRRRIRADPLEPSTKAVSASACFLGPDVSGARSISPGHATAP